MSTYFGAAETTEIAGPTASVPYINSCMERWPQTPLRDVTLSPIVVRGVYAYRADYRQPSLGMELGESSQRRRLSDYDPEELRQLYAALSAEDTAIAEEDIENYSAGLTELDNG